MARPRKTPDKQSSGGSENDVKGEIEDAVVLDDVSFATPEARDPAVEETAPEASPEIGATEEHSPEKDTPDGPVDEPAPQEEPASAVAEESTSPPSPDADEVRGAPPAPPPPARSGASLAVPLIFGGILAALAGVAASRFIFPDGSQWQAESAAALSELRSTTEAQTARIAELEGALAALRDDVASAPDPTTAVAALQEDLSGRIAEATESVSGVTGRLDGLDSQISALSARLEELAMRPMPEGLDPASLDAELGQFRDELSAAVAAARSEIVSAQEQAAAIAAQAAEQAAAEEAAAAQAAEATRAAAEAAAAAAARDAAVARILAAMESGEPFAEDLAALEGVDIPAELSAPAADGVPTLSALADRFPEAARNALDAAIRADAGDGAMDRLTAFLRVQTGARSLEPRDGDDPDAILSRAEAAVRAGDLAAALAELGALPEAGQAQMAGWIQSARTRLDALAAAQSLPKD